MPHLLSRKMHTPIAPQGLKQRLSCLLVFTYVLSTSPHFGEHAASTTSASLQRGRAGAKEYVPSHRGRDPQTVASYAAFNRRNYPAIPAKYSSALDRALRGMVRVVLPRGRSGVISLRKHAMPRFRHVRRQRRGRGRENRRGAP